MPDRGIEKQTTSRDAIFTSGASAATASRRKGRDGRRGAWSRSDVVLHAQQIVVKKKISSCRGKTGTEKTAEVARKERISGNSWP